jgi:hypothetical protein
MISLKHILPVLLVATGCAVEVGEIDELDPASSLDYEWWDEGPPEGEEAESPEEWVDEAGIGPDVVGDMEGDVGSVSSALSVGVFQLPFPCGQVWAGQTRSNHSPRNSIDFNRTNDAGDPVVASAAGTVSRVGNTGSTSYGRWIEINHGDGYRTRYAHLATQGVRYGQRVSRGQRIGTVGSTGGSTGPHLHFELRRNGVAYRPVFNGSQAYFYGTRNYRSYNQCATASGGAYGTVRTSGTRLTVRSGPGTAYRAVSSVANGTRVLIRCHKAGSRVSGTYGSSTLWDYIGTGYVSDAYVYTGSDGRVAPWCS